MKIKQDCRVIQGTHRDTEFVYSGGKLEVFGVTWSKEKIETLVEIANLLEHHKNHMVAPRLVSRTVKTEGFFGPYERQVEDVEGDE